jgi:hypothetical protein
MQLSVCFNYLHPPYEVRNGKKKKLKINHKKSEEIANIVQQSWCLNDFFDEVTPMIDPDAVFDFSDEDNEMIFDFKDKIIDIANNKLISKFNEEVAFPCYLYLDSVEPVKIVGEHCYTLQHPDDSKEWLHSLDKLVNNVMQYIYEKYAEEEIEEFNELVYLVIVDIIPKDTITTILFPGDY